MMTNSNDTICSRPKLLKGGRVIDPAKSVDELRDVLVQDGKIVGVEKPGGFGSVQDVESIDCTGKLVVPGLHDIHVHLREPGQEWKETILTGSQAAVAGGFTTICCMSNTLPTNDTATVTEFILDQAKKANLCRVRPIGAITVGREGKSLAPMLELTEAGCVAFSDDGAPVSNAGIMRRALEYNLMCGTVLTVHEEVLSLSHDFSMHESARSLSMGLKGMPGAAEDIMIARDIELARLTGGRVHFCHVTTARAVTLIRRAKEDGIPVTAEVTPHHFTLSESSVQGFNTEAKVSMPLRSETDVEAMMEGVATGVIDCIASDHAPHEADSKACEFERASFGLLGLQTMLPLTLQKVREGKISLPRAIAALTTEPARCFRLPTPRFEKGAEADITVIDLDRRWKHTRETILSKSKNTPFLDWEFQGMVERTFVGGRQVFSINDK